MADDYGISAPCLLDELMDSQVITCDVDFGSADPVFAVKGSPSHESDSGCSDMSEVRSVSPTLDIGEIGFPELNDFSSESITNELDEDLESYLQNTFKTKETVDDRPFSDVVPPSPEEDTDSDPDYEPPKDQKIDRRAVTSARKKPKYVSTPVPKADLCVLPDKSTTAKVSTCSEGSFVARPAVKVVKVIKTPAQNTDIGSQLMQALDERNKKNAKQAKINREKKKVYIKSLEDEIDGLKAENWALKEQQKNFSTEKKALEDEVEYLKSVLANQSALSGLLQNIGAVTGVKLSSSFSRKRQADLDHDYHSGGKWRKPQKAGVCLHVDDGNVSLEFCSQCAKMAKISSVENS